jgi:hypothetical protein
MRRTWLAAVAVVAVLVVAIVFVASGRSSRKVPEPAPGARPIRPTGLPAKRVSEPKPADCAPLAAGGYSCGACRDDQDCPEGSACIINLASGRTECHTSDCSKNQDCEKGNNCRVVARASHGEAIRACVSPGARPAGAACDPDNGGDPSVSCAGNMVCINGGCAPPCEPTPIEEDSAECGYLGCIGTDNGYGCTPSCKQYPCGGGKTCSFLSTEGPISLCTHVVGANCLGPQGGCSATQDCIVETNTREERTTFRCVERCTLDDADMTCPKDSVCVLQRKPGKPGGHCRRRCSGADDTSCGSGEQCRSDHASGVWYCSAT